MPLSDEQLERYSRQVIVPGIGAQGQERLLGSRVLVLGAARGVAQACLYLRAAGVAVVRDDGDETSCSPPPGAVVVAGVDALCEGRRQQLLRSGLPIFWYRLENAAFTSGCHPLAPLPEVAPRPETDAFDENLHDAAACDAAAAACALILGIPTPVGPFSWDLG